jgi:hypothetical protein
LYLGSKIDENGGIPLDIQQRINKARGAFSRLKNIWRASKITLHLKIKLFNACVKSVLLCGCETWFVTNNIMQKLQAFVNRWLRNILGIIIVARNNYQPRALGKNWTAMHTLRKSEN